jgi:hypothetical protein
MQESSYIYIKQLESLILDTLLPVYEKYHKQQNIPDNLDRLSVEVLKQVKVKKKLPVLLMKNSLD